MCAVLNGSDENEQFDFEDRNGAYDFYKTQEGVSCGEWDLPSPEERLN
ncbi:MAG: hypothetical protein AB1805_06085 [Nitrospirota bacterium]